MICVHDLCILYLGGDYMSIFSNNLRMLREQRGLTREQLSKATKISASSINMYERGEREPSFEIVETFADFFNVDLNYLIRNEKNQTEIPGLADKFGSDILVLAARLNALPEPDRSRIVAAIHTLLSSK